MDKPISEELRKQLIELDKVLNSNNIPDVSSYPQPKLDSGQINNFDRFKPTPRLRPSEKDKKSSTETYSFGF